MITAAVDAGVPAGWAAADEAYGNSSVFRTHLRHHRLGYVLAVSRSYLIPLDGGKTRVRADRVAAELPASAWQRRSAGAGSKGPRFYAWAWLGDVCTDADPDDGGHHSLFIRRNTTTGELAFYHCWAPRPATLAQLVHVAGIRWTVEESFQAAKGQVGLDQHQVRRWGLLAPVHHTRPGRTRRPGHLRRRRRRPQPNRRWTDQAHRQRDPPPDQHPRTPADPQPHPPSALVTVAAPASSPSPTSPLHPTPHLELQP
jgi:hypothetical protein